MASGMILSPTFRNIQNTWNPLDPNDQYKLKFDPKNPAQTATAKISEKGTEHLLTHNQIVWLGVEGLSEKKLQSLTHQFLSNFQVTIKPGNPLELTISRRNRSLLSYDSAHALSRELESGFIPNSCITDIISKMISHFISENDFPHADEIFSIFPHATLSEQKHVIHKFIHEALEKPSQWEEKNIKFILSFLKTENYHFRSKKPSPDDLSFFASYDCTPVLDSMLLKKHDAKLPSTYLSAIIVFLEMLQASNMNAYFSRIFRESYKVLTTLLENKKDDEAAFFLAYIKQALQGSRYPIEKALLQKWLTYDYPQTDFKEIDSSQQVSLTSEPSLFKQTLEKHIPWITGLQSIKQEVFQEIDSLSTFKHSDLLTQTTTLLEDEKNKVIFIKGQTGSGKSTFLRRLTHFYLENYSSQKEVVPLYFSISDGIEHKRNLINMVLYKYGLHSMSCKLEDVRTIWIFDGLKNLKYNFFLTNHFELWKKAQIVLCCRTENLQPGYQNLINPFSGIRRINKVPDIFAHELEISSVT